MQRFSILLLLLLSTPGHSRASAPEPDFEVLVIGTVHAPWQFRSADFTPAHVEAALKLSKPDVIGVESNPTWFARNEFYPVTYEAQGIALPFAKKHGIPVYGIDWMNIDDWEQRMADNAKRSQQWILQAQATGRYPSYLFGKIDEAGLQQTEDYFKSSEFDFRRVNDIDSDEYGKKWVGDSDPSSPNFGGKRNQMIVQHCVDAMQSHPGKRLVVVIGAGHKYVLEQLFGLREEVKVLRFGEDVPAPTDKQVAASWTVDSLLNCLGHNLDGERTYFHPQLVDLPRMNKLVERLKAKPGQSVAAMYYEARVRTMEAQQISALPDKLRALEQAEALFNELLDSSADPNLYPFPMDHWRMRYSFDEARQLEHARVLYPLGKTEEARRMLHELIEKLTTDSRFDLNSTSFHQQESMLADPGFEAPLTASGPQLGWYSESARNGDSVASLDSQIKHGGEHSLRFEIQRNGKHPHSMSSHIRRSNAEEIPFQIWVRGEGVSSLNITGYTWRNDKMHALSQVTYPLTLGEWTNVKLSLAPPENEENLYVFLYFRGKVGAKIWFDDAFDGTTSVLRVTEEWKPRVLAREFPVAVEYWEENR